MSIGLNGVILISPAINMGALPFATGGNDLTAAALGRQILAARRRI